ncbi:MAG: glycosyltransferase family 2 protein [Flavisolibacter sp.]|nr:glycosyltransferase family 2 protein [Flavisolibacter sp.]
MGLSIIIVNYRSGSLVIDCIRSLQRFNEILPYEIIVVDNSSCDGSDEMILSVFPVIRFIQMGYNAGFARANNAGIRAAKGEVFLLLNPDTISVDDSIQRCYQQLMNSDHIAAGVQLLDQELKPQISGNYFVKGGLNHLLPIPYWGGMIKWLGYRSNVKIPNVREAKPVEVVDWISGAFLMVKKVGIMKAGLMVEDFFLYAEEVEWCHRLGNFGQLCIFGDLKIIHLEGGSINKDQQIPEKGYYNLFDRKGLQLMVSNHLRVRKQYSVFWFLFLLLNYSWGCVFFFIVSTIHRLLLLKSPFDDWVLAGKFAKNVLRLWALAPKIISGRPHFYKMF